MEDGLVCKMDCHNCDLQDGIENKVTCATLLLPSMFNLFLSEIKELKSLIAVANTSKEKEVKKIKIKGIGNERGNNKKDEGDIEE